MFFDRNKTNHRRPSPSPPLCPPASNAFFSLCVSVSFSTRSLQLGVGWVQGGQAGKTSFSLVRSAHTPSSPLLSHIGVSSWARLGRGSVYSRPSTMMAGMKATWTMGCVWRGGGGGVGRGRSRARRGRRVAHRSAGAAAGFPYPPSSHPTLCLSLSLTHTPCRTPPPCPPRGAPRPPGRPPSWGRASCVLGAGRSRGCRDARLGACVCA